MRATARGLCAALALLAAPAAAADLDAFGGYAAVPTPLPRFFPRSDGVERRPVYPAAAPPRPVGCTPRRAPVPTDAPDDPSYSGSPYGLGQPSRYGFTPPLGVDDPFGRSLLPYCR